MLTFAPIANSDDYYMHPYLTSPVTLTVDAPGVLLNDTDADGDQLTAFIPNPFSLFGPDHGGLSFPGDGGFTYEPQLGFTGIDFFTYNADDGSELCSNPGDPDHSCVGVVQIHVGNTNPEANPLTDPNDLLSHAVDLLTVEKNTTRVINPSEILFNDTDKEGDALSIGTINGVTPTVNVPISTFHGTLTLVSGGNLNYVPNPGFDGTDTFQYQAKDDFGGLSNNGEVTLKVLPIAHINESSFTISEGDNPFIDPQTGNEEGLYLHALSDDPDDLLSEGTNLSFSWYIVASGTIPGGNPANLNWGDSRVMMGPDQVVSWANLDGPGGWGIEDTTPGPPALIVLRIFDGHQYSYDTAGLIVQEASPGVDPADPRDYMTVEPIDSSGCGGSLYELNAVFSNVNPYETNYIVMMDWNFDGLNLDPDPTPLDYQINGGGTFSVTATHDYSLDFGTEGGIATPVLLIFEADGDLGGAFLDEGAIIVPPSSGNEALPPDVSIDGPATGIEAQATGFTADITEHCGDSPIYAWSVADTNGNDFTPATGTDGPTFNFTPPDNGHYLVTLEVTDTGGTNSMTTPFDVENDEPTTAITDAPASAAEGAEISLGSSTTDPSDVDTAAGFTYAWSVTKNGNPYATGTGAGFSFTPNDNGSYVVSLTATDKDGGVGAAADATINITNLPPSTGPISGPSQAVREQSLTFTSGTITDPGAADTFMNTWQVLDSGNAVVASGSGTNFSFTPAATGNYTVEFTVTDDDGGSVSVSQALSVFAVLMQGNTLLIGGTDGDDVLDIKPGASAGQFKVLINGASQGNTFAPTSVQWFGGAGTDTLTVEGDGTANTFEVRTDRIVFNGVGMFDNGIESRVVNAHGSTDQITLYGGSATVNGGAGSDTLKNATGTSVWTLTSATAGSLNGVLFSSIEQLVGAGSDTLVGPNTSNIWKITGAGSGTLGGGAFSGFAALQGGTANDTFRITEGVVSGLSLDGGAGTDKLDYAAYLGAIQVDLAAGTATGAAHVSAIENVQGGDGADIIHGDGNDNILAGGAGTDILVGGAGNDTLSGGAASDLLIGGTGGDLLAGNADEDILIGGTTSYDANDAALVNLLAAWSGAGTYSARVTSVSTGSGVAGGWYLLGEDGTTQTVFTDFDVDTLTGAGGKDFFFANKTGDNGGPIDNVTDQSANEFWDDTDF